MSSDDPKAPFARAGAAIPVAARTYGVSETLRDGSPILIRAIRPDDRVRLLAHFHALSPDSVRHRFMGMRRDLGADELARLCDVDFQDHVGLVATLGSGDSERFIGVGRFIRVAEPRRAEVAFAVLDQFQGQGIATVLLRHLARIARQLGIEQFEADVMSDNPQMLEVFDHSGFQVTRSFASGIVHVRFPTGA
jgi:RimJ/RimL family protein N-acetyltransferase